MGVDISEPLIGAARAQGLANATFEIGDAASWPFEDGSFDLVFSRFGVMFFGDPVAAFGNIRRALKPGGRMVFICWRTPPENPWAAVPMRAAQPHLPPIERPGPEDPGQYSFGDRARVERILDCWRIESQGQHTSSIQFAAKIVDNHRVGLPESFESGLVEG